MTRLLALLALLPAAAAAQSLDGSYSLDPAQCGNPAYDGRMTIAGGRVAFWESACDLTAPVAVRDMGGATLFDMVCRGEGETWTRRLLLVPLADGGLARVEEGLAAAYARCP